MNVSNFRIIDIPGSHVVILNESPSETTIKEAAMLAGYFSKAGSSVWNHK
jgi:predicted ribosome quality control (RQC) complex YloA/Tae2 family protein